MSPSKMLNMLAAMRLANKRDLQSCHAIWAKALAKARPHGNNEGEGC